MTVIKENEVSTVMARVPGAFRTQFAVLWLTVLTAKSIIGQHDAASTELLDKRIELLIRDIHGIPIPVDAPFRSG